MNTEPTNGQIMEILAKHLDVKVLDIKRITEGFTHYLYDCRCELRDGSIKNYIVRISFNTKETTDLAKELLVIETYARRGIPVPVIYGFDIQHTLFNFDYMVMEKFEGQPLKQIMDTISAKEKKHIAKQVGELLRKIHSIELETFGDFTRHGLKKDDDFSFRQSEDAPIMDAWKRKMLKDTFHSLSGLMTFDILTSEQCHDIMEYIYTQKKLIKSEKSVLIHGDFHADHILMKDTGDGWIITGLVDFEFAFASAPEYDFIKLHRTGMLEDAVFLEGLIDGYGKENISPDFDAIVEFYRVTRDIGFVFHLAQAGNYEFMKTVLDSMFKIIQKNIGDKNG